MNTSRSRSATAWSRCLGSDPSFFFSRSVISANAAAAAAFNTVIGTAQFIELPTARNSNLLPVNANGEVRLRSVLSLARVGILPTPISSRKCSGSLVASPFIMRSMISVSCSPTNADRIAGGASFAPSRRSLFAPETDQRSATE